MNTSKGSYLAIPSICDLWKEQMGFIDFGVYERIFNCYMRSSINRTFSWDFTYLYITSTWLDQVFLSGVVCGNNTPGCRELTENRKRENYFIKETSVYWPSRDLHAPALDWMVLTIFELFLFILVVKKADLSLWRRCSPCCNSLRGRNTDVMSIIARDSSIYFAV